MHSIFKIGISRNMKCAYMVSFLKYSHKCKRRRKKKSKSDRVSKDHADALVASIPTEKGKGSECDLSTELSSDEMLDVSSFTDEESQVEEKMATIVENECLMGHQNAPVTIGTLTTNSGNLLSKCDVPLAESLISAQKTDQSLATPKGMIEAKCQSLNSPFTLSTSQEEMINKVLGPGAPDERIINDHGIVLRRQDFWTLNNCQWLNDQIH